MEPITPRVALQQFLKKPYKVTFVDQLQREICEEQSEIIFDTQLKLLQSSHFPNSRSYTKVYLSTVKTAIHTKVIYKRTQKKN